MMTDKNPRYFYSTSDFPQLAFLESETQTFLNELQQILVPPTETAWFETFPSYTQGASLKSWEVFTFCFFGMSHPINPLLCPKSQAILSKIPELISCDFSKMKPHTEILPHKGYSRMVLRCHLPLIVPAGNLCGIKVGEETRDHEKGKLLIFDDSFTHNAWNHSDAPRIVLMFDIPNPNWGYTAAEISEFKIKNIDDPFLLSIASKEKWIEAHNQKILPL